MGKLSQGKVKLSLGKYLVGKELPTKEMMRGEIISESRQGNSTKVIIKINV